MPFERNDSTGVINSPRFAQDKNPKSHVARTPWSQANWDNHSLWTAPHYIHEQIEALSGESFGGKLGIENHILLLLDVVPKSRNVAKGRNHGDSFSATTLL